MGRGMQDSMRWREMRRWGRQTLGWLPWSCLLVFIPCIIASPEFGSGGWEVLLAMEYGKAGRTSLPLLRYGETHLASTLFAGWGSRRPVGGSPMARTYGWPLGAKGGLQLKVSKKPAPQSYSHKKMNSSNDPRELASKAFMVQSSREDPRAGQCI